jgi:hypothetical protein
MSKDARPKVSRVIEAIGTLERVLMAGDSPGVKMAAGLALEVLLGQSVFGRPVSCLTKKNIGFSVSVTLLSDEMEHVLTVRRQKGLLLPRKIIDIETSKKLVDVAHELACSASLDQTAEIVLSGRALSVEIWDDADHEIQIGFNFLAISRNTPVVDLEHAWQFTQFSKINVNILDPREALALSEMLCIMGIKNPYDLQTDQDSNISAA